MKSKKILILLIIAIILIISIVGVIIFFQNQKKEYDNNIEKYENLVNISNTVNNKIDQKEGEIIEFLSANSDNEESLEKIDELKDSMASLDKMKIQIEEKSDKLKELKISVEKMENKIKEVDEALLFESGTVKRDNVDKAISDIDKLIEKINTPDNEEETLYDLAPQKEVVDKMLLGNFSYIDGTYSEVMYGNGQTLTIKSNGLVTIESDGNKTEYKMTSIKKKENGTYFGVTSKVLNYNDEYIGDAGFEIYPIGVKSQFGDQNKIRIVRSSGISVDGGFQKD